MSKILIIGLDGGTFDLIKPWVKQGKLPVIASLLKNGSHGYLRSTLPPMTFPAWNAFMTGKNPGKHGVFDFTERELNSYKIKFTNALNRKAKTIWQILSEQGKTVAVIGVPVTYPPEKLNGIMIGGFDAPGFNPMSVYPPELYQELKRNVGEYIISPDIAKYVDNNRIDDAIETILYSLRQRSKIAKYILKLRQWDCFMIVFMESDVVCHHFWEYHDHGSPHYPQRKNIRFDNPILTVYEELDHSIGELINIVGEDTVKIVVSDHGFGGTGDKIVYLNKWLELKGFLTFKNKNEDTKSLNSLLTNTVFATLKTLGTQMIPQKFRKKLLYSKKVGIVNKIESILRFSSIEWVTTYAYSEETPYYPNIWINLKGREPDGIVEPEDYDALRIRIIKELLTWTDEEGNHLVRNVFKREDIYHGNYIEKAPDLIIDWNLSKSGYSYLSRPSYTSKGKQPIEKLLAKDISSKFLFSRSGSHRDFGIFIINGKMIKQGNTVPTPMITDLAPTVLYLLSVMIPRDIDGKVLADVFDESFKQRFPVEYSDGTTTTLSKDFSEKGYYTDDEEEKIRQRLKGLGYIN